MVGTNNETEGKPLGSYHANEAGEHDAVLVLGAATGRKGDCCHRAGDSSGKCEVNRRLVDKAIDQYDHKERADHEPYSAD